MPELQHLHKLQLQLRRELFLLDPSMHHSEYLGTEQPQLPPPVDVVDRASPPSIDSRKRKRRKHHKHRRKHKHKHKRERRPPEDATGSGSEDSVARERRSQLEAAAQRKSRQESLASEGQDQLEVEVLEEEDGSEESYDSDQPITGAKRRFVCVVKWSPPLTALQKEEEEGLVKRPSVCSQTSLEAHVTSSLDNVLRRPCAGHCWAGDAQAAPWHVRVARQPFGKRCSRPDGPTWRWAVAVGGATHTCCGRYARQTRPRSSARVPVLRASVGDPSKHEGVYCGVW